MANNIYISFDLMSPGQSYHRIEAAIKALGPAVKMNQTFWYVKTAYSAKSALTNLSHYIDENDKIVVVEAREAWWKNIAATVSEFVQRHWH